MIRSTCERCGSFFQGPEADVAPPSCQDLSGQCLACIESNDSIFKVAWPIPFNASNSNGSALAIWFLRQFEKPDFLTGIAQLSLVITFGGAFLFFLSGIINYMITEVGTAGLQQLPDNRTLIVALILNLVFAGIVSEFIFTIYGFAAKIVLGYRIDDQVPVRAAIVTHIKVLILIVFAFVLLVSPDLFRALAARVLGPIGLSIAEIGLLFTLTFLFGITLPAIALAVQPTAISYCKFVFVILFKRLWLFTGVNVFFVGCAMLSFYFCAWLMLLIVPIYIMFHVTCILTVANYGVDSNLAILKHHHERLDYLAQLRELRSMLVNSDKSQCQRGEYDPTDM